MNNQNEIHPQVIMPRLIFWELTRKCNLDCRHCRAEAAERYVGKDLTTNRIKSIIDDIAQYAHPIIVFTGGEPLCRNDIYDIALYADQSGFATALATNGTLLSKVAARRIKASGISRVAISLDGATAATHDAFRGVKGSFNRAIRGAYFVQKKGVDIQFNVTVTRQNVAELEDLIKLAEEMEVKALHLFLLVPVGCGVEIAESHMLPKEKAEEILHWFYKRSKHSPLEVKVTCAPHYYRILHQKAKHNEQQISFKSDGMHALTKGCLAGSGICFISHTGDVQPCGYLPLVAGNLESQSFKKVWEESELLTTLRDQSQLKGKCGECEYVSFCGGCRARAYLASGDFLDEDPNCIYKPSS